MGEQRELLRDRDASFEPRIVPKHGRSFDGFDEQILHLYAGGMSTRDIQRHLRELYDVDVSEGLVSEVTGSFSAGRQPSHCQAAQCVGQSVFCPFQGAYHGD